MTAFLILLIFACVGFIDPGAACKWVKDARIVPYFETKVPGDDTFLKNGNLIVRNCKYLDACASADGARTLSSFGFTAPYENWRVKWHNPDDGIQTISCLLDHIGRGDLILHDGPSTAIELRKIADKLQTAKLNNVRFCLHLRIDSDYSPVEFDRREGRYF